MKWTPALRLVLASVLFLAWLGWLAYLVVTSAALDRATGGPAVVETGGVALKLPRWVLSRPQLLAADLVVIADLRAKDGKPDPGVTAAEVYWAREPRQRPAGPDLVVPNLPDCANWAGAGRYILPLVQDGPDYRVPLIPRSPGYDPLLRADPARIYLRTEAALRQLQELFPEAPPKPG